MRKKYIVTITIILLVLILAFFIPMTVDYSTPESKTEGSVTIAFVGIETNSTPLNFQSSINDPIWIETQNKFTTSFDSGTLLITNHIDRESITTEVKQEHIDDMRNMCEFIMLNKTITKVSIPSGEITENILPLIKTSLEDKTLCPSMINETRSIIITTGESIEWVRK